MSVVDEILEANERYAADFDNGELGRAPSRNVVILTCIDARIMPSQALGLLPGEANIIRNAGGRAGDAMRSLVVSTRLLGVRSIVVVHHTDCGLHAVSNEQIRERIAPHLDSEGAALLDEVDFLPFSDLEQSVRDDVALIRESPLISDDVQVSGFVYDVRTGRLVPVD